MDDDDLSIRTTCELEISLLLKLALWDHESWLLAFVGHLFSPDPTRFTRMRLDKLIVTKHSYGRWASLGSFDELARQFRSLAGKIRLDADEYGILMGRLASLRWRSSRRR
jgi:hypothetical protein